MHDRRARYEELANAVTHGLGAVASMVAGTVLVTLAALFGDLWQLLGAVVFSGSLLLLYGASALYHAVRHQVAKARLRVLDHCAIYVLIAGTYTPFALVSLRERWGWVIFGVVWSLTLAGVVFKLFCTGKLERLSTATYLAMGWLSLLLARPLLDALSTGALLWLVAGGLSYTVGTAFFHSRRIPFAHAIWHLFVLAGSICHYVAVALEVVGPAACPARARAGPASLSARDRTWRRSRSRNRSGERSCRRTATRCSSRRGPSRRAAVR